MNATLLLLVWSWPLLLAVLAGQRHARWVMVIAPLPALLVAALVPVGTSVSLPWLLLGVELGLDDIGRVFLLFSALLWLIAGLFEAGSESAAGHGARYRFFFLLAMAGNLGLIVAQDTVSFYLGFTLMGLAAYGLIAHPAKRRARQAARRYLAWTIAGELILFVAIVMLTMQHAGALAFVNLQSNPPADLVVLLLVIAFGIKLALPGLHLWLPRAYAVAPASAVAVLSGAMIKAGLLGWLRFLTPADAALAGWGQILMVIGVVGIFFGAILGLLQQRPRLLLAYSSISKMGVLTAGMGATLAWPAAAPALISALVLYAAHHALVKAALFLGLGLVERGGLRPWLLAGLGFLALVLA
ncbi:MAG: proton-conducting transporter membrane subunit, partial [Gammaproteobacteria bacterium]